MRYEVTTIPLRNGVAIGMHIELPDTHLIIATTGRGYITCGLLDVAVMDQLHPEQGVVVGRAIGVLSIAELLEAPLQEVIIAACALGIAEGLTGYAALEVLL